MTQEILISGVGVLFCAGWCGATISCYRSGWHRTCPWFCRWLLLQTVQACVSWTGGAYPSPQWWLRVWWPIEAVTLVSLLFAVAEIFPRRMGIIALTAGLMSAPFFHRFHPLGPDTFADFVAFREWVWMSVGVSLLIHLALLRWHPVNLAPGAFRSWCWLLAFAFCCCGLGRIIPKTDIEWMSGRVIFRLGAILCCVGWLRLSPRMRKAMV